MTAQPIRAVLWDFGGVLFASPFEGFSRYELVTGLPKDFLRGLNATNPDTNAWARFERTDVTFDEFCVLFEAEATQAGYRVDAREVMVALRGDARPQMFGAVRRLREHGFKTAGLTNNVAGAGGELGHRDVHGLFDVVIESSKVGFRKPEPRFYELACEALSVNAGECVFLDDLGINLKPAAAMGMRTIKVIDPDAALAELETLVGFSLR